MTKHHVSSRLANEAALQRQRLQAHEEVVAALRADPRYADQWKREQIAGLERAFRDDATASIRSRWSELQTARADLRSRLAALRTRSEDRINWPRVEALAEEYRAALGAAPGFLNGSSATQRAARFHAEAKQAGDIHRLRALRVATAEVLDRATVTVAERLEASILRQAFREDERNELGEEVAELERIQNELIAAGSEFLGMVRDIERTTFPLAAQDASAAGVLGPLEASLVGGPRLGNVFDAEAARQNGGGVYLPAPGAHDALTIGGEPLAHGEHTI